MDLKIGTKIRILRVLQEDAHYNDRDLFEGKEGIIQANDDQYKDSFSGSVKDTGYFRRAIVEVLEVPKEKRKKVLEGVHITKNQNNKYFNISSDQLYFTTVNFPLGIRRDFTKVTLEWEE